MAISRRALSNIDRESPSWTDEPQSAPISIYNHPSTYPYNGGNVYSDPYAWNERDEAPLGGNLNQQSTNKVIYRLAWHYQKVTSNSTYMHQQPDVENDPRENELDSTTLLYMNRPVCTRFDGVVPTNFAPMHMHMLSDLSVHRGCKEIGTMSPAVRNTHIPYHNNHRRRQ